MKKIIKNFTVAVMAVIVLTASCFANNEKEKNKKEFPGMIILEWNEIAYRAFDGPLYQHSLMAARINAMTHLAMHDALNAAQPVYATYLFTGTDLKADPVAAAVTAAYAVLVHEIPAKKGFLDSALEKSLLTVSSTLAKEKGIVLGRQVAKAIIDARGNDGSAINPFGKIIPSVVPGVYQAVPPFDFIFAPAWEHVKLFVLQTKDQFRPAPHPALGSVEYAKDFNEVKSIGQLKSETRTPDKTAAAKFWYEFSEAGWNRVARIAAAGSKLDLHATARLFALVDMAMADAYTAGWDSKIHYNFWRPYTAIRNAGGDGNDATSADVNWEPSEPTPPVQDYPSTHSALGNAAATVLAKILGDNIDFTMTSLTAEPAGSSRNFTSFSQAANENADSRVQAGIHFRFSCVAGQEMGTKIGNWAVNNYLMPLNKVVSPAAPMDNHFGNAINKIGIIK